MTSSAGTFDRFAICEAAYQFASDYHEGQWSTRYTIFGRLDRLGFRPSPLLTTDSLDETARMIYDDMVDRDWQPRSTS